jgi:hypothetical protein
MGEKMKSQNELSEFKSVPYNKESTGNSIKNQIKMVL